jgi:hypothetical protein
MSVTTGSTKVPKVSRSMFHSGDIVKQGIYEVSSVQLAPLGMRVELGDGRVFRYAKNGAVALVASKLNQAAVPSSNYLKCAISTAAVVGDGFLKITTGAAVTANQFAEGYVNVDNGAGFHYYKVSGHAAGTTGVQFNLFDSVLYAYTTAYYATLTNNPWDNVVVMPVAKTSVPIGVNLVAVSASVAATPIYYYFWAQTWGPCNCLLGAGPAAIGDALMASGATAGSLITATAGFPVVGNLMRAEQAADYGMVFLTISP